MQSFRPCMPAAGNRGPPLSEHKPPTGPSPNKSLKNQKWIEKRWKKKGNWRCLVMIKVKEIFRFEWIFSRGVLSVFIDWVWVGAGVKYKMWGMVTRRWWLDSLIMWAFSYIVKTCTHIALKILYIHWHTLWKYLKNLDYFLILIQILLMHIYC